MIGAVDGFIQNGRNKLRNYSLHVVFYIESNKRSIYMFFLKLNLPQRRADLITAFSQHSCYRIRRRRNGQTWLLLSANIHVIESGEGETNHVLNGEVKGSHSQTTFWVFVCFGCKNREFCRTNAHVCKKWTSAHARNISIHLGIVSANLFDGDLPCLQATLRWCAYMRASSLNSSNLHGYSMHMSLAWRAA